jgi:hypothetical protein
LDSPVLEGTLDSLILEQGNSPFLWTCWRGTLL